MITPFYVNPLIPEEWRIVNIPGIRPGMYMVNNFGQVYSIPSNKLMKPSVSKGTCYTIGLATEPGKSKTFNLDYIVASAFLNNPNPSVMTKICHKNNVQTDCDAKNLFYADPETYKAYNAYTDPEYKVNLKIVGWKPPKLTNDDVTKIRMLYNRGFNPNEIKLILNLNDISESAIRQAANGTTFKDIK